MNENSIDTKIKKQAEDLANLTLKEVKALIDVLKNEHGIEAAAPVAIAGPKAPAEAQEPQEEKTIFNVSLKSAGSSKLGVIKIVKNLLGLGLKEAKEMVESAPVNIKEDLPKEEAEKIKKELEGVGAQVELK